MDPSMQSTSHRIIQQFSLSEMFANRHDHASQRPYSLLLVLVCLALYTIGFIIVTSASMPIAERMYDNPYHFAIRHGIYVLLSITAALIVLNIPMQFWRVVNPYLLFLAIALLIIVIVNGKAVYGSTRWIVLGPITVQPAEPAKLFFFLYLAGYLVRRYEQVQDNLRGFFKPLIVFFVFAALLLMQPDLGTVVVMFTTTLALLFLAGARLGHFLAVIFTGAAAFALLIATSDYRRARISGFLDPWADPFGDGYQLTQSLMAYGRGSWFGEGLGNSLQKLEFLPEAHTDFIMAILAEEFGYVGILIVLVLLFTLIVKGLQISNLALSNQRPFEAFTAYGISIWICLQTAINIGASSGLLPTKGLTLPLVSYGGSSLIIMSIAVALLVRIDFELRVDGVHAISRSARSSSAKKTKAGRGDDE
ncbi:cell division protein ftsW [Glaciecola punicea ACAM 611]|uniref:Probable peptidoglycan glycosyltransferase FtsW n=2 Tax=Glaciecola TaxID=89404 RepID=H5TDL3_9ALTE|nr:cell division protein ftsW [Glaciecola punicea ACAM 611]